MSDARDAGDKPPFAAEGSSNRVRIYEVGPRDGLQNESAPVATAAKLRYIELLAGAGLREIEATSFVSPRAIPQLADADELMAALLRSETIDSSRPVLPVLVPNLHGFERAERAGATALAVFTAATDAFTEHNIGRTVEESLADFEPVLRRAAAAGWWRRAYVSTAFGCPYSGRVDPHAAVDVARRLLDLGVDEVCFGDTIGVGVPSQVTELTELAANAGIAAGRIAFHFHDTRGTALANVVAGLAAGIRCFDASTGGTGGCPYAPGAAGNLATEDLVYLLDGLGYQHGVRLDGVLDAAHFVAATLGRPLATKVGQAGGWDPGTGGATRRATDFASDSATDFARDSAVDPATPS